MSLIQKRTVNCFGFINENTSVSLCRICLENGASIPIFESNGEETFNIQSKLSECLKEKIEDIEGYPRCICNICCNILDSAYNFIKRYRETSKILESGIDSIKEENETINIKHFEEEIEIENIKNELDDGLNTDDDFSNDDKEFLEPLHKIKLKAEKETKNIIGKKFKSLKTNSSHFTNKIASSILEGQFAWNGDIWCLKPNNTNKQATDEKSKLLQSLKSVNRRRLRIEIPKIKKPNPPKLCDLCGEVFKDQDKLSVHKRKVHFPKTMVCPHCSKVLSSKYYLNRHIKRKHSDKKDFICTVCGRAFAYKAELHSHNKNVHEKHLKPKKQYKCKYCPKIYKCGKSVTVHERSAHTGQRPAVCSVCDSSFYHEDYLKEHMRLHTGETPFKCPVCGRGYAQRCNMKSHLRIHRVSELDAATLSKLRPNYLRLLKA